VQAVPPAVAASLPADLRAAVVDYERGLLQTALERYGYNQTQCADALGLTYNQMRGLVRKHGFTTRPPRKDPPAMTTPTLKDHALLRSQAYIDGQWCDADSGKRLPVNNPATGDCIIEIASVGKAETRRAIEAAARAMPEWSRQPAKSRAQTLRRWFELIMENQEDLARLMTAEQGKPLAESRGEVAYGAAYVEWFGEEAKRLYGDVIPGPAPDKRIVCIRQPVGVVAAITPWNFPIAMIARKAAPALAAGCSIVIKPASETPLCALALAELAERAGHSRRGVERRRRIGAGDRWRAYGQPHGAQAHLHRFYPHWQGAGSAVRRDHEENLHGAGRQCALHRLSRTRISKPRSAVLSPPSTAMQDRPVCVPTASSCRTASTTASSKALVERTRELSVGNGFDDDVLIGPLVNAKALEDVDKLVQDSIAAGARLALGGGRHDLGGNFYQPTVLAEVTDSMPVFRKEIFGPVAPVVRFDSEEEVVAMANDTEFGLASYFYTRDIGRVWRVAEALEYGIVGINEGMISNEMAPFGGVKESGSGREGSRYGMDDYVEIKYMLMGGL
jgi:succinate-semialdehyde dehydrogenase/glutarate-semialdehyde dehydrogenase